MVLASSSLSYDELVVGLASAFGSLVIVLTYLLFPNLRKLRYIELVFYVAINDLLASIGLALGPVPNDSFACWFQGLTSTINFISSAFWTTVILYQVYLVVVQKGRVLKEMFWIHAFCWGWPVVVALLPLTTNTYNNPDDESTWCFVASTSHSPPWGELFWVLFSFFVWIWLCMIANCVQVVLIVTQLQKLQVVSAVVRSTVRKLLFYPIITILCWTLNTIANVYVFTTGASFAQLSPAWDTISTLGIIMAGAQGILNAAVFLSMNMVVREHWAELLYRVYNLLFCCTIDRNRPTLRTSSQASLAESSGAGGKTTTSALHKLELDPHEDHEAGPISQADIFRDTVLTDVLGEGVRLTRLSEYFSVALPVDEEMDYVGEARTGAQGDVTEQERKSGGGVGRQSNGVFGLFRSSTSANVVGSGGGGGSGGAVGIGRGSLFMFGVARGSVAGAAALGRTSAAGATSGGGGSGGSGGGVGGDDLQDAEL